MTVGPGAAGSSPSAEGATGPKPAAGKSQARIVWEQFRKHKIALFGLAVLIVMYLMAAFAGFIAPYGMNEYRRSPSAAFVPPMTVRWTDPETGRLTRPFVYAYVSERHPVTRQQVWVEDVEGPRYEIQFLVRRPSQPYRILGMWRTDLRLFGVEEPGRIFLWGTNNLGKDVFTRVMYGGQVSLTIGVLAVWVSLILGLVLGVIAGFYGGLVDDFVMRLVEVVDAIPGLFLLIVLATLLKDPRNPLAQLMGLQMTSAQTFLMVVIVLGLVGWGGLARTIRSLVLGLREMDYASAAKALGASETRVMFRHLLPGTASYVMVVLTLAIPGFILAEVGLSFLGLGPSELDSSSWGIMLRDATARGVSIQFVPWLLIPGIPIFLAVLCWNLVGDGLRDAFDPKKRR